MATRKILKLFYFGMSLPHIFLSQIAYYLNVSNFKAEIDLCSKQIEKYKNIRFSSDLLHTLQLAEDHRNNLHFGIDQIAMFRALICIIKGDTQGASTIEQQFVRVVVNRYQRTLPRKLKEQLLAIFITLLYKKNDIATAYLCIAFYGHNKIGISGINTLTNDDIENINYTGSVFLISHLKYPKPRKPCKAWIRKHCLRNQYLTQKLKTANKKLHLKSQNQGV